LPRLDGVPGYPRKPDLLARALQLRDEYYQFVEAGRGIAEVAANTAAAASLTATATAAAATTDAVAVTDAARDSRSRGPLGSPMEGKIAANPFQQGDRRHSLEEIDSPVRASVTPVRPSPPRSAKAPAKSAPKASAKAQARRRSSVSWLDPALLAQMHSDAMASQALAEDRIAADPPPPEPEEFRQPAAPESDGDELVLTEDEDRWEKLSNSSGRSAFSNLSDVEEDGAGRGDEFGTMTVPELKEWLSENRVPFLVRSKKATLVSLARAHMTHLQASTLPSSSRLAAWPVPIAPAPTPVSNAGLGESVPPADKHEWKLSKGVHADRASTGRIVNVSPQRRSTRKRIVNRKFISTPTVDNDADDNNQAPIDVDADDGSRPFASSGRPRSTQPNDRRLDPDIGSSVSQLDKSVQTDESRSRFGLLKRARSSAIGRLSLDPAEFGRRLPTLTPRAVMGFVLVVLLALLAVRLHNTWRVLRRPFCPSSATECSLLCAFPHS
jgi:hypothetical protein